MDEGFLRKKLDERTSADAFRRLTVKKGMVDFCSNDYLGIVKYNLVGEKMKDEHASTEKLYGSTGSRLLSGNFELVEKLETDLAEFHDAQAGLIFNSGYDANVGLLSCVPQRGDTIFYDQLCHASIRDGIRLSFADSHSFIHNDVSDLQNKLGKINGNCFVITESVFSMDGHTAPLKKIADTCEKYNALLIIDEAHATGVVGEKGEGLVQTLNIQNKCFARIHTFGKAVGSHGAIVLGSKVLKDYLVNFSRPFIFTTGLPASAIIATGQGYAIMSDMALQRGHLQNLVGLFKASAASLNITDSNTPIQAVIVPGNSNARKVAASLQEKNMDVRPILYPTVPQGAERLRIVLHAFNTEEEVHTLVGLLKGSQV